MDEEENDDDDDEGGHMGREAAQHTMPPPPPPVQLQWAPPASYFDPYFASMQQGMSTQVEVLATQM